MKLLSQVLLLVMSVDFTFCQQVPNVEVRAEYIWERPPGDERIVLMKDTTYQEMLKRSFMKALSQKWNRDVSGFSLKVSKLPSLRTEPKFNTTVLSSDTSKWYVFLQIFDEGIAINPDYSALAVRFRVKYRLLQGAVVKEDLSSRYSIMRRQPAPGQVKLNRFSFYPSHLQYAYDTIAYEVVNGLPKVQDSVWLNAAYGYTDSPAPADMNVGEYGFGHRRQSISLHGVHSFDIIHDSMSVVKTGRIMHVVGNTINGFVTLLTNLDSRKERSSLFTAIHYFREGSDNYNCSIHYVDTKFADRRAVKDDEGWKSLEVTDYRPSQKHISRDVVHSITLNGDTISVFTIDYVLRKEDFVKMWDGIDSTTMKPLSAELNNPGRVEMVMKGTVDDQQFEFVTSDVGRIKRLTLNRDEVFTLYEQGKVNYRTLDKRKLKFALLLCMLCDKYSQYK